MYTVITEVDVDIWPEDVLPKLSTEDLVCELNLRSHKRDVTLSCEDALGVLESAGASPEVIAELRAWLKSPVADTARLEAWCAAVAT